MSKKKVAEEKVVEVAAGLINDVIDREVIFEEENVDVLKVLIEDLREDGFVVIDVRGELENDEILKLVNEEVIMRVGVDFMGEKVRELLDKEIERIELLEEKEVNSFDLINEKNEKLLEVFIKNKEKFGEGSEVFEELIKIGFRLAEIARDNKREGYARNVAGRASSKLMEIGKLMGFPSMYKLIKELEKGEDVEYVGSEKIEEKEGDEDVVKDEDLDEYRSV